LEYGAKPLLRRTRTTELRSRTKTSIDRRDVEREHPLQSKVRALIHFEDARRLDDGRFLLPLGKPHGAIAVDVDAGKPLAVVVVNGDLPVAVPAPTIHVQTARLPLALPLRLLFHGR